MSKLRRTTLAGIGLVSSLVLVGCAGSSGTESPGSDNAKKSQSPGSSQGSGAPDIANPKNASAVDVCSLLPADAADALGVNPEGEKKGNSLDPSLPDSCVWKGDGGSKSVSFSAIDGRSINVYYMNSDVYLDFKKLTVAGYPVVRANKTDPMAGGSCGLFMATKKNQVVQAFSTVPSKKVGKVNPCEISKKALKLSASSWPAAK